ncbi:MAG: cytochrome c [Myxococcales bacterium]|nr:cytochrome c [Myxococcales bacterium]
MRFLKLRTKLLVQAAVLMVGATACRLDMHDAPRYDALEPSSLFDNGAAARLPVDGTIARGELRDGQEAFYTGFGSAGFVQGLPPGLTLSKELLERGRERFEIYCTPCHGYTGQGDGMIVKRGFRKPPTFHNTRNKEEGLGRIYFVITNGYGQMFSYAHAVKPKDRWAIAAYIRALQLSHDAPLSAVPVDKRTSLEEVPQ